MMCSPRQDVSQKSLQRTFQYCQSLGLFKASTENKAPSLVPAMGSSKKCIGPELYVLQELARVVPSSSHFGNQIIIGNQHFLPTTGSLFDFLLERNAEPSHMIFAPISYSIDEKTKNKVIKAGINVIENASLESLDGFRLAYLHDCFKLSTQFSEIFQKATKSSLTKPVDGIIGVSDGNYLVDIFQQAMNSGKTNFSQSDVIFIQQEAANRYVTTINLFDCTSNVIAVSPMLARVAVENIIQNIQIIKMENKDLRIRDNPFIGIIGLGKIGSSILKNFIDKGYRHFIVYDRDYQKVHKVLKSYEGKISEVEIEVFLDKPKKSYDATTMQASGKTEKKSEKTQSELYIEVADSNNDLFIYSDFIIGCTGFDISTDFANYLPSIKDSKIIFNAFYHQNEISSLLSFAQDMKERSTDKIDFITFKLKSFINNKELIIPRLGTSCIFPNTLPKEQAQLFIGLIAVSFLQASEMQKDKKAGMTFEIANYKVSPLFQLFINVTWLEVMDKEQLDKLYTEDEKAKLRDITKLNNESGGKLYLPFERKARIWLDKWLKVNNLDTQVDEWLKISIAEIPITKYESSQLRSRL